MKSKNIHKRTGMTLVELLVVIAIIGMLIGILLPAINSVGEVETNRRSDETEIKNLAFINSTPKDIR